jgi:hypothetical protein
VFKGQPPSVNQEIIMIQVQPLTIANVPQDVIARLVQSGVKEQVAKDLAVRITRNNTKLELHDQAATDAFLATVLTLARGGEIIPL